MSPELTLKIEYRDPRSLTANEGNARRHSLKQIGQLQSSMTTFGNVNPILVDENNVVIAGHGRLQAALGLNLAQVPTVELCHLSDVQKHALMLADNKIALNADWDSDKLRIELQLILNSKLELLTGFEIPEMDFIIGQAEPQSKAEREDPAPAIDRTVPARTASGDIWELGPHRLLCGSALDRASYATLMPGERAQQVLTDPPYNVPIDGHVGGLGKRKHAEFKMATGEMSVQQYTAFLQEGLGRITAHVDDGAILIIFIDWRHIFELLTAGKALDLELKNICVWVKANGGMGSLYRSQHEFAVVFKSGRGKHMNNVELGKHGRYRTNVWEYAGANSFHRGRQKDLATHPTVKPVAMVMDAIKDCSGRGNIILDPFGGSGTTLIAAERTGRVARLIELDPYYCDATIKRWEELTGLQAVLAGRAAEVVEVRQ